MPANQTKLFGVFPSAVSNGCNNSRTQGLLSLGFPGLLDSITERLQRTPAFDRGTIASEFVSIAGLNHVGSTCNIDHGVRSIRSCR